MDERRECGEPRARARSPRLGRAKGAGARHAREWSAEIADSSCGGAASVCRLIFWLLGCYAYPNRSRTRPYKRSPSASIQSIPISLSPLFIAEPPSSSLHPDRRRASAIRRAGLRNPSSSRSCTERGRIRFLGSVFTRLLVIF
jgi:hypothetical protein